MESPNNYKRHYPKEKDMATNHWKAQIKHYEEYDNKATELDKYKNIQEKKNMHNFQDKQIALKYAAYNDQKCSEKEQELNFLNQSLEKYKKEMRDRQDYKQLVKLLLVIKYCRVDKKKTNL